MTAGVNDPEQVEIVVKSPADQVQRSQVGPVPRRRSEDFSDALKKLLAGLEPKVASEALARAETLGQLPPAQQTLLRCALAAASETFKKAEILQEDLVRFKEQQRQAQKDLFVESQALCRRSAFAEAQVIALREDLAATITLSDASDSRFRKHRSYLWLALATAVSAGMLYAVLLSHAPRPAPPHAMEMDRSLTSGSEITLHRGPDSATWQREGSPHSIEGSADWRSPADVPPAKAAALSPPGSRQPIAEQALNRLDSALDRVPLAAVDSVLNEANQWLRAAHTPPCFIRLGEGETSLLVRVDGKDDAPFSSALVRCAEAVEHVVE